MKQKFLTLLLAVFMMFAALSMNSEAAASEEIPVVEKMEAFTEALWTSLNEENKVSLFVRYIDIATGEYETKILNKNK